MLGSALPGSHIYGEGLFGVYAAEVAVAINRADTGVLIRNIAVISSLPHKPRIPDLDIVIDLIDKDIYPTIGIGVYGSFAEFGAEIYTGIGIGAYSLFIPGFTAASGPIRYGIKPSFDLYINSPDDNAISWSNIGAIDFTKYQDNIAGKKPLEWRGYVYSIGMINETQALVYGVNGISVIAAKDVFYGERQIFPLGIKSKHAVCFSLNSHFFISKIGELWSIDKNLSLTKHGYKEYLSTLNDVVMSFDRRYNLIYICDGTDGYVYSLNEDSLTKGYSNITGRAFQDGIDYIISSGALSQDVFSFTTDIVNFGSRKNKNIYKCYIETDYTGTLQLSIDYRTNQQDSFSSTPWVSFSRQGDVSLPCFGTDFKFKIKALTSGVSFKVEKFTVFGQIHNIGYRDFLEVYK